MTSVEFTAYNKNLMTFPSFADATGFMDFGAECAKAIGSPPGRAWEGCYSPIRPIGIIGYYTMPHFFTDDPVTLNYIILMMNLLVFLSMVAVMGWVMAHDPGFQPLRKSSLSGTAKAFLFLGVLFLFLGHLPVTLADLPANALFVMAMGVGYGILFSQKAEIHPLRYCLLGLLAAGSTLMKQNFIVFGGLLGLVVTAFDAHTRGISHLIKKSTLFLLGFSLVLIQFLYIYSHSGDFFLFERKEANIFSANMTRETVELVAYTVPIQSAYHVNVTDEVNDLTIFVLKVYSGIFRIEIPVYLGSMEKSHPPNWTPRAGEYVKMYLLVGMLFLWLLFGSFYGPKSLRVACLIALGYVVFSALWHHTEYRYYLFPRLVLWITTTYWIFKGLILGARKLNYGNKIQV